MTALNLINQTVAILAPPTSLYNVDREELTTGDIALDNEYLKLKEDIKQELMEFCLYTKEEAEYLAEREAWAKTYAA